MPAYATIPAAHLATGRLRQRDGNAVRVWLYAQSVWTPKDGAVLPIALIAKVLHVRKASVATAIAELSAAGLLTLRRRHVAPIQGQKGSAAVYNVVGRKKGETHQVFDPGDRRLQGFWRRRCADLRRLAEILSPDGARVLICLVLACHRDQHSEPQLPIAVELSARSCTNALPKMTRSCAHTALLRLIGQGLIAEIKPARGRKCGIYTAAGLTVETVRRGGGGRHVAGGAWNQDRQIKQADNRATRTSTGMVTTRGSRTGHKAPRAVAEARRNPLPADAEAGANTGLRPVWAHLDAVCVRNGTIGNNKRLCNEASGASASQSAETHAGGLTGTFHGPSDMNDNQPAMSAWVQRRVKDMDSNLREKLFRLIGAPDGSELVAAMHFLADGPFERDRPGSPWPFSYNVATWAITLGYICDCHEQVAGALVRSYELTDTGRASIAARGTTASAAP